MSSRIPLDALFAAYVHDLTEIARLACAEQEKGLRSAQSLVGKLALESVRLSVSERLFLLPVVAEFMPEGQQVASRAAASLDTLEERAAALEGLDHRTDAALPVLEALKSVIEDIAREQRGTLLPGLADALPDRELLAYAEPVTPTVESGATHSHPKLTGGHDLSLWPQKGVTAALREAFISEAHLRTGSSA